MCILDGSVFVTLHLSCNNLQFSFFFSTSLHMMNICKPPQSWPWWLATREGAKLYKRSGSSLRSSFSSSLKGFCTPWGWKFVEGGQILMYIWDLFGLPVGNVVKLWISRALPVSLAQRQTHTHTHSHQLAWRSISVSQWQFVWSVPRCLV